MLLSVPGSIYIYIYTINYIYSINYWTQLGYLTWENCNFTGVVLLADHFVPKSATETDVDLFHTVKTAMFSCKPQQNGRETWTEKERPENECFFYSRKRVTRIGWGRGGSLLKALS